jgi:hypothetical protein
VELGKIYSTIISKNKCHMIIQNYSCGLFIY